MQYQVPQFIETEDKLVGGILSLKQFAYFAGAGLISAGFYFSVRTWIWVAVTLLLVVLAAAFAFLKINGRPLLTMALAALNFYRRPQMYIWQSGAPKLQSSEGRMSGGGLERVLQGFALQSTWRRLQTGTKKEGEPETPHLPAVQRYQISRQTSGELRAARRVDYR